MKKQQKYLLETSNTLIECDINKERQELISKFSDVVLYSLLRVKNKTTLRAALDLSVMNRRYCESYSNLEKLTELTGLVVDKKLAVDYIREELGIKKSGMQNGSIDEDEIVNLLKHDLAENSEPITDVLLEMGKKAYADMSFKDTLLTAQKLIKAIEEQSDIENFPYIVKNVLLAMQNIESKLSDFIAMYTSMRSGSDNIDLRSILGNALGTNETHIARTVATIMENNIANEMFPSWPKITIEKSENGKSTGFQVNSGSMSGYFSIVYLKPNDYNLIANFVVQLKDMINDLYEVHDSNDKIPKLSIITYSDLGICVVGSFGFAPQYVQLVKHNINELFSKFKI